MYLGYNTNGFAHHRLDDAVRIISELGYRGLALTPDVHHLDPFQPDWLARVEQFAETLRQVELRCVLESGARFVLDPWRKHQPTLLSPMPSERQRRREFLQKLGQAAPLLGCDILSLWSGTPVEPTPRPTLLQRLSDELLFLLDELPETVRIAFEPEPGMFVETMEQFAELEARIQHPRFGLTLDIGHLVCLREWPVASHILHWAGKLWNVHLEDMRAGVHDHLAFGEGEVPFTEVLSALRQVNYGGGVFVELSRHSHDAVRTARASIEFLGPEWR